eukprot:gene16040-biopygen12714
MQNTTTMPDASGKVVKSSGGLICPLADFGGLGGPGGGLADWRTLPGGLWWTAGGLLADFWRTGGLLADSSGLGEVQDSWRSCYHSTR